MSTRELSLKVLEQKLLKQELTVQQINELKSDTRKGAYKLWERHWNQQQKNEKERRRLRCMFRMEKFLWHKGYSNVAGVDEVGRGPLAGPVVAAAVILPDMLTQEDFHLLYGLNDSKKLTATFREEMCRRIFSKASFVGIGMAEVEEIDYWNIYNASLLAMERSVDQLEGAADFLLVDGKTSLSISTPQQALKKGDTKCASVAAASVIAKVTRDNLMEKWEQKYPFYGLSQHKGYATLEHKRAIKELGPTPLHRRSFLKNI